MIACVRISDVLLLSAKTREDCVLLDVREKLYDMEMEPLIQNHEAWLQRVDVRGNDDRLMGDKYVDAVQCLVSSDLVRTCIGVNDTHIGAIPERTTVLCDAGMFERLVCDFFMPSSVNLK